MGDLWSWRTARRAACFGTLALLAMASVAGASAPPGSDGDSAATATDASIASTVPPPPLGKAIAVNDALPRVVTAGVTQADAATTEEATAGRIGFFTITPGDSTVRFDIVSQSNAVPADGFTSSVAVYLIPPDGSTYRAAMLDDGGFGVSEMDGSTWTKVADASMEVDGQVTTIDVDAGAWTVPGTTIVVIRRDVDASMNGWESATPPVLIDALSTAGFGGTIPLIDRGTALATEGLTNTPCAIADMPTIEIDPDTHAVTFTFESAPAAGVRATIGGVSLVDLINPPYISGTFDAATWSGQRAGSSIGDFAVTADGTTFTVETTNDDGSVFDDNHEALTIGISDPGGCYSLSPAVPFTLLLAPLGEEVTTTTSAAPPTTPATPADEAQDAPTVVATTTVVAATASPSTERFENEDSKTPWGAIIVIGLIAIAVGIAGGVIISRRDQRRRAASPSRTPTRDADVVDEASDGDDTDGSS